MSEFNPYTSDPFASDNTENGGNPYQQEEDISKENINKTDSNKLNDSFVTYGNPNSNNYYKPSNDTSDNFTSVNNTPINSTPINAIPTNVYTGGSTEDKNKNLAVASMVLGLISMITFCICVGEVLAIVAIILGAVYLSKSTDGKHKGNAITGIITGILSIASFIVFIIWALTLGDEEDIIDYSSSISEFVDEAFAEDYSEDYSEDYDFDINFDVSQSDEIKDVALNDILMKSTGILLDDDEEIQVYLGEMYEDAWITDYDTLRGWLTVEGYKYYDSQSYLDIKGYYSSDDELDNLKTYYGVKNPKAIDKKDGSLAYGVDENDQTLFFLTCFLDDDNIKYTLTIFAQNDDDIAFVNKYLKYLHNEIGISDFSKDINL